MKIRILGKGAIDFGGGKVLLPGEVYDEKVISAKEMADLISKELAEDADKVVKENKTAANEIEALKALNSKQSAQIETLSAEIEKKNEELSKQSAQIETLSAEISALKKPQK